MIFKLSEAHINCVCVDSYWNPNLLNPGPSSYFKDYCGFQCIVVACAQNYITLFKSITMLCETNNIPQNIPHNRIEYGKYSVEYFQSHKTLLWIWIMLCMTPLMLKILSNVNKVQAFLETLILLNINATLSLWD